RIVHGASLKNIGNDWKSGLFQGNGMGVSGMYFTRKGKGGRGIVGFHGWSGDHTTFLPLMERLPEAVSFYSYDLPGCGRSPEPVRWEIREVARDVAKELLALGRENLTIVGSCTGGLMAVFVARELAEMGRGSVVGRLVLIDPFAFCPWYFQLFLIPAAGPLMYATALANPLGRGITNLFLRDKRAGETHLTRDFAEVNHRAVWRYLKMLSGCGRPDQFRALNLPVDILYGEKTFSAVRQSVREWGKVLPQSRVRELQGVGHLPISEGTKSVAKVVFR
ncbi:MAG: alpha/beta fold hydrolase, partial [Verrucomicrobia bacterium]|nr:alpha/beta fold hydrolase [Verrucomicrobiota bacterium]